MPRTLINLWDCCECNLPLLLYLLISCWYYYVCFFSPGITFCMPLSDYHDYMSVRPRFCSLYLKIKQASFVLYITLLMIIILHGIPKASVSPLAVFIKEPTLLDNIPHQTTRMLMIDLHFTYMSQNLCPYLLCVNLWIVFRHFKLWFVELV